MKTGSYTPTMDERPAWLTWRTVMLATTAPAAMVWAVLNAENVALRHKLYAMEATQAQIDRALGRTGTVTSL